MGRIVHIVDSDLGYGYNLAVHSWKIAQGLTDARELLVFCRAAAPGVRARYDARPLGLGRTAGRLLKGLRLTVARRLPSRKIESFFFERALERALQRLDVQDISVIHTWPSIPRLLAPMKKRRSSLLLIRDYTMALTESASNRADVREELAVYDWFFSPSAFVSESLLAAGVPGDRIVCIPYGVDPDEFAPLATREPGRPFSVAFSGLVGARKGVPTLLEAWRKLGLTDATLNLYGRVEPAMAKALSAASRKNVVVHGFVDLKSELPRNDVFVFPTSWEGSAKAVYEALACGLPVITTPNAGAVVEDGVQGFIVPPGDAEALAAKMQFFHDNRAALARFSAEARKQGQRYSWKRYAESVIDHYRTLAPVAGG